MSGQPNGQASSTNGGSLHARQVAVATFVILGILAGAYILYLASEVLLLVFVGILLASAIEPLVERMRRGPFSRGQGVLLVYTVIVAIVTLVVALVVPPLLQQIAALSEDVPRLLNDSRAQVAQIEFRPLRDAATRAVLWAQDFLLGGATPAEPIAVVGAGLTLAHVVAAVVSVFVIAYYWLVERANLKRTVLRLTGPKHADRVNLLWVAIEARLGAWVRGQLVLMGSVGVGLGVGYVALGVPGALPLALWAALAEMIPMVGPYLGVAPALLVALTVSPTTALLLAAYAVVIQSIEGYVLLPRVMGHAVGVSPLVVFLGILVGAALGGLPGAFLAVPVAGALQVILQDLLAPDTSLAEARAATGVDPRELAGASTTVRVPRP